MTDVAYSTVGTALAYESIGAGPHSSGGILALLAAVRSSDIVRVAVYEPPLLTAGGPDPEAARAAAELRALLRSGRTEDATRAWFVRTTGGVDEGMRRLPWWPSPVAQAHTLPDETALTGDGSLPLGLDTITASTLIASGGASGGWAAGSAETIAATIPGSQRVSLPGQQHVVDFAALAPVLVTFFAP